MTRRLWRCPFCLGWVRWGRVPITEHLTDCEARMRRGWGPVRTVTSDASAS